MSRMKILVHSQRAFFTLNFAFMKSSSMLLCLFTGSPSDVSLKINNQITNRNSKQKIDNNSVADPGCFPDSGSDFLPSWIQIFSIMDPNPHQI
jgi:hypothetical protein